MTPPLGLYINPRCDASHEERRLKNSRYARGRELAPGHGAARDGRAVPCLRTARARHCHGAAGRARADKLPHKHTTNARVSDPRPKCREEGTGLTAVLTSFTRLRNALPPEPVRVIDVGPRRFASDVVNAQGGRRAGGVCGRGGRLPLGASPGAVHAHQLQM